MRPNILFALASGRRLEDQLNVLKSLANRSNTVHVLFGTYELLRIRNLSGQLSRRSIDIHFPRYDVAKASDRRTFARILQTFGEQMPLPEPPDLVNVMGVPLRTQHRLRRHSERLAGQGGWPPRFEQSAPTLTLKHLEKHALSVSQCDRLIEEAARGESQFREDADALERLRLRLGFPEPTHGSEQPATAKGDHAKQRYPGHRHPKRDIVGVAEAHDSDQTL